ncbi:MAG: conjugal transfer protein TraF [Candidatus Syntrophosphaera sp.]|nr:conjugal transfer protein TraF [Candidatus Syntrophosphaera sp.]
MKHLLLFLALALSLALSAQQPALPVTTFDYAIPDNNVSPICIGMGGLNVTNAGDFFASYSNPALIGANTYSALLTSFRLKNEENLSFWEAASISNALRDKQFKYFTLLAKNTAWTYQPVASVHIVDTYANRSYRYYDYQMDKVQVSLAGRDDSWQPVSFGLNLKYLTGRLVYQVYNVPGENDVFIDDKIKGFSTDLGVTMDAGSMTFGVSGYDLFSRLYWENYPSVPIQRRMGIGAQYNSDNMILKAGLQGKLSQSTDTTYHFGFQYLWDWNSPGSPGRENVNQGIVLRLGMYSHDFYGTSNINYTFGTGYNYNVFRFDFSMNNQGMKIKDSEYLFSLGVGMP